MVLGSHPPDVHFVLCVLCRWVQTVVSEVIFLESDPFECSARLACKQSVRPSVSAHAFAE